MRNILIIISIIWAFPGLSVAQGDEFPVSIKGLIDARIAYTDPLQSGFEGGLGKTRFGGNNSDSLWLGRIAEASLILGTDLGNTVSASTHLKYDNEQKHPLDLVEAVIQYRPLPIASHKLRLRVGAFFPSISLEHNGLGWTTTRTISASAINTWIGEEIRTVGAELAIAKTVNAERFTATAAAFGANDVAGVILAWRGWALHSRKTGLFDRIPLAPTAGIAAGGPFEQNVKWVEPFHEFDDRLGYYTGFRWQHANTSDLRVMYYDNHADVAEFDGRQYGWRTRFTSVGLKIQLPADVELLSQYLFGNTNMGVLPNGRAATEVDFSAFYALLSKPFGRHRVTGRIDLFSTTDVDPITIDDNNEYGWATTMAYALKTRENQTLMLETQYIYSNRPARADLGLDKTGDELLLQANYRITF